MEAFFQLLSNFWTRLFSMLDSVIFTIGGYRVGYGSLILAFLILAFVIGIFWKGAKA